jgi:hypothetical protein
MTSFFRAGSFAASVFLAMLGPVACEGCRGTSAPTRAEPGTPTVRLYFVSDLAGALEPCGCTKDQLGGLDHFAAWVSQEQAKAPFAALAAAGPLFFMDPELDAQHRAQDIAKAETLAAALKKLGLVAFAPAKNDWAVGPDELARLSGLTGAASLVANGAAPAARPSTIDALNGVRVGYLGVSTPEPPVTGMEVKPPLESVRAGVAALKQSGANVIVLLASVGRGEAKRLAELVPELTVVLVGSPGGAGEGNTEAPPPERIGDVLVIQTGNHLQTVATLDLYVRDGQMKFADASGIDQAQKKEELRRRIDELHVKIAAWELDGKIAKTDLDARRADLAKLEAEKVALDVRPAPSKGSFFRYSVKEIRESLGRDAQIHDQLLAYYKQVNESNRVAFKDRLPRSHDAKTPIFIGIEVCTTCHEEPRAVWDKTRHARAYASLSSQFKEFNLDCVGCHVTGYELPGGSTVTHVDRLKDVQCEVCHGPGSQHALHPNTIEMPVKKPEPDSCVSSCHHPPHVEEFDAKAKMEEILGPGHGKKS